MRRRQWIEIHDQPWFPKSLRDLTTDTLQFIWNFFDFYKPVVPRLRYALQEAGTHRILDLCSGGGGPWLSLVQDFEDEERFPLEVCLTDRFPNPEALEHPKNLPAASIFSHAAPVDATRVPADLEGFRTLFSSFHHFPPDGARAILQDAVKQRQGVGIFEVPKRNLLTIVLVLFMPVMAFALGPFIRPFRWSRLLWTYLIPVIPFVVWFDGVISCLRAYTPPELRALTRGLSPDGYRWEAGETGRGRMPVTVTYLIGYPLRGQDDQTPRSEF
jgi:hypothetical protein